MADRCIAYFSPRYSLQKSRQLDELALDSTTVPYIFSDVLIFA